MSIKPILTFVFTFVLWPSQAQDIDYNRLAEGIDSVFNAQSAQGMQLIVVSSDSVLMAKNYGINPKTDNPVDDQSLYLLNAVTEPFTAIGLLQLLETKQISINSELKEIAPEVYFENEWEEEYPIKIRHLIAHTTGWQKGHFHHFLLDRNQLSLKEIVLNHPQSRVSQYPPGQFYSHSNDGYSIAGYLIEKLSGMSYEDYISVHVLEPLGMSSSSFNTEATTLAVSKNSPAPYPLMTDRPSDGLVSNATDIANFLQLLLSEDKKDSQPVINPSIIRQVKLSANTLFDQVSTTIAQGYGLYQSTYRGTELILVKGSDLQFSAQLMLIPAYDLGVFFVLTGDESNRIGIRDYMLSEIIPPYNDIEDKEATLDQSWTGYYQSIGYAYELDRFINNLIGVVAIDEIEGSLYFNNLFETPQPILPDGENNIMVRNNDFHTKFTLVKDFENRTVLINSNGEQFSKTSGALVWTRIALAICSIIALLSLPVVGLIRFVVRLFSKRSIFNKYKCLMLFQLSILPIVLVILTVLSLVPNEPIQSYQSMQSFASLSLQSVLLFVATLAFGIIGLIATLLTISNFKSIKGFIMKGYLAFLATIFPIMIYYLTTYGIIGLRGWVM